MTNDESELTRFQHGERVSCDPVSKVLDHALLLVKTGDAIVKALQYRKRALALVAQLRKVRAERDRYGAVLGAFALDLERATARKNWNSERAARFAEERNAAQAQLAEARALLLELYAYAAGPNYELPDGKGLVLGMDRGTLGEVFAYLWPDGKKP